METAASVRVTLVRMPDRAEMKRCSRCGAWLPADGEHFHRDRGKRDGLCVWCKACKAAYNREYAAKRKTGWRPAKGIQRAACYDLATHPGEKFCGRCGMWKPANETHFYRNRSRYDGLTAWCRECRNAYIKARRAADGQ